ncbi:hypothetical protein A2U01_0030646, partial [Trifolium medium]|nr:hypothetical protein [Trifolium medium]
NRSNKSPYDDDKKSRYNNGNLKRSRHSDDNLMFGNTTMAALRQNDEVWSVMKDTTR